MYLYHYTSVRCIDSIVNKGMIFGSEINNIDYGYGTGPINAVLEEYMPKNLPHFINRDQCIFFYPLCQYRDFGNTEIKVDSEKLEKDKIYVADLFYAQQIWNDTVDYSFSEERSDVPLSINANKYWESFIPYDKYLENKDKIKYPEVLYFGKIPFDLIEITTTLHPIAQNIFSGLRKFYKIERWSSMYGDVYTSDKQHFTLDIEPSSSSIHLSSKSGVINHNAIDILESLFSFSDKKVFKNGNEIKVIYDLVDF